MTQRTQADATETADDDTITCSDCGEPMPCDCEHAPLTAEEIADMRGDYLFHRDR